VAAEAQRPEVKHVEPGGQKFIPIEEMSAEQLWEANHQNDKARRRSRSPVTIVGLDGKRSSPFDPNPDDSWPES